MARSQQTTAGRATADRAQAGLRALRKQRLQQARWPLPQRNHVILALAVVVFAIVARTTIVWLLAPTSFRLVLPVPRLNASSADAVAQFFKAYHGRLPVVIEGALITWPAMNWTIGSLGALCPSARLPVYEYDLHATDWAALREVAELPLREYFAKDFGCGESCPTSRRYGLEMSLRNECPLLLEDVRVPAFFMDDLLARYHRKGAWPTLITGPNGSRSGLHRDTHNLPFWMALLVGRKRWRVFSPEEPALSPHFIQERNGFAIDPFAPDFVRHPDLASATVYEHVLEPGQLLYIPSGAPHAAFNLQDTLAVSQNYLDPASLHNHLEVTCSTALWRESPLCWRHNDDFLGHTRLPEEQLREVSYFESAGFAGPAEWCAHALQRLREGPASRRLHQLPIVEDYCSSRAKS